ncbi:unnamed protein product [Brassica oleracea]
MDSLDLVIPAAQNPWKSLVVGSSRPVFEVSNGVAAIDIPEDIYTSSDPLWKNYVVGYFIGDAPHVRSIHATVNRIWTSPGVKVKIDVQFISKTSVLFRIENEALQQKVLRRRY